MSKSKALIAAEQRIAALEARVAVAKEVYRNQRARIEELEAALNTRGVKPAVSAEPTVTHWVRADGALMEKVLSLIHI